MAAGCARPTSFTPRPGLLQRTWRWFFRRLRGDIRPCACHRAHTVPSSLVAVCANYSTHRRLLRSRDECTPQVPERAYGSLVRVTIRVKPGASRTIVGGDYDGALVVAVRARAVDGKATEAALRALAEAVGATSRDVRLVSGTTSRTKIVEVPEEYRERIVELREGVAH